MPHGFSDVASISREIEVIISAQDAQRLKAGGSVFACETLDQAGRPSCLHVVIGHGDNKGKLDKMAFELADRLLDKKDTWETILTFELLIAGDTLDTLHSNRLIAYDNDPSRER